MNGIKVFTQSSSDNNRIRNIVFKQMIDKEFLKIGGQAAPAGLLIKFFDLTNLVIFENTGFDKDGNAIPGADPSFFNECDANEFDENPMEID